MSDNDNNSKGKLGLIETIATIVASKFIDNGGKEFLALMSDDERNLVNGALDSENKGKPLNEEQSKAIEEQRKAIEELRNERSQIRVRLIEEQTGRKRSFTEMESERREQKAKEGGHNNKRGRN